VFCDILCAFVTILLNLMSNVKTRMLGNMLLLKCVNKVSGRRGKTCEETVSHMDACLLACSLFFVVIHGIKFHRVGFSCAPGKTRRFTILIVLGSV
jgi:hypothetical protein